jgi:hypothetical protein
MAHGVACAALADCVAHTCRGHWLLSHAVVHGVSSKSLSHALPHACMHGAHQYSTGHVVTIALLSRRKFTLCLRTHSLSTPPLPPPPPHYHPPTTIDAAIATMFLHQHQQARHDHHHHHHTVPRTGWGLRATRGVGATSRCFKTSSGTSTTCVTVGSAAMMPFALATATSVMRRTGAPLR